MVVVVRYREVQMKEKSSKDLPWIALMRILRARQLGRPNLSDQIV